MPAESGSEAAPTGAIQILNCQRGVWPRWQTRVLSAPYWRLYHNATAGWWATWRGERVDLLPERVVVVPPRTEFLPGFDGPADHAFLHFTVSGPWAAAAAGLYVLPAQSPWPQLWQAAHAAWGARRGVPGGSQSGIAACQAVCWWVLSLLPPSAWVGRRPTAAVRAACDHLRQHLHQPLSNTQLARLVGMHPTAFVRAFTREMGLPPQAWHSARRLEVAADLLRNSDRNIDAIAAAVGCADRYHFSRLFRRHYGLPPARFRRAGDAD